MKRLGPLFLAASLALSPVAMARGHGGAHHPRSQQAKRDFKREHPCPSTGKSRGGCPGYVIDHVQALKHGGADAPSNMQWQTKEDARAKDKWE
ncbi:MAG: HNH endonuclease signature motif containing protein [Thiobacillaceae bacterium]